MLVRDCTTPIAGETVKEAVVLQGSERTKGRQEEGPRVVHRKIGGRGGLPKNLSGRRDEWAGFM